MHKLDLMLKLQLDGRHEEARQLSDQLESEIPTNTDVWYRHRFNRGWFLLRDGDFQGGYQMLEAGRFVNVYGSPPLNTNIPIYNPNIHSIKGKTIVLHLEGGLGDQIISVRFAKSFKNMGVDKLILTCDSSLTSIFSRVEGIDKIVAHGVTIEEKYDYWIPGFSAGWLSGSTFNGLSGDKYLSVNETYVKAWKSKISSDKPKIGLKWFGSLEFEHQQFRRFPTAFMSNLSNYDANFYSLQLEGSSSLPENIKDLSDSLNGWEDTLAAISQLDLVITSCTSIAHAAAALGKETWVLVPALPYYVWTLNCPESDTSPFYNSVKLFRQSNVSSWNSAWQKLYRMFESKFNFKSINQPNEDINHATTIRPLMNSYNVKVDDAYIITIEGNKTSEEYSKRCSASCDRVGMSHKIWKAFDGTKPGDILVPDHAKDQHFFNALKISNHYITRTEIAATLSHISLWLECARLDKPIVILEHDAIMLRKFTQINHYNSVVYLGGSEWYSEGWPQLPIPPFGSDGPNYRFMLRAHAYAIDPAMARNLLAYVLKYGISGAPDYLMRADLFSISHQGLYAYDHSTKTTISNRDILIPSVRNDDLSI
jgi:hypothetical protein